MAGRLGEIPDETKVSEGKSDFGEIILFLKLGTGRASEISADLHEGHRPRPDEEDQHRHPESSLPPGLHCPTQGRHSIKHAVNIRIVTTTIDGAELKNKSPVKIK